MDISILLKEIFQKLIVVFFFIVLFLIETWSSLLLDFGNCLFIELLNLIKIMC